MPTDLVPNRVLDAFVDCFTGREVLRTVDELFLDVGFAASDPAVEHRAAEAGRGMRRSRALAYIATLNLSEATDAQLLLQTIEVALLGWEKRANPEYRQDLDRLIRNLRLSGFDWDGERLLPTGRVGAASLRARLASLGRSAVDEEASRIFAAVEADPADAITAAPDVEGCDR